MRRPGRSAFALTFVIAIPLTLGCTSSGSVLPDADGIPAVVQLPAGAPGVQDGRTRFREIFCGLLEREQPSGVGESCDGRLHRLADERPPPAPPAPIPDLADRVELYFVPGLLNGCLSGALLGYNTAFPTLEERGYAIERVPISSFGGTSYNADRIAEAWPSLGRHPERKLVLAGYSKGAPDILEFLIRHPDLAAEVDAVVTITGAVSGSPVADETSELTMKIVQSGMPGCDRGDEQGIQSMRRATRLGWLAANPLPDHIRYFSLGTFTDREHVSRGLLSGYDALARIDPRTDGQLLAHDQIVPGSILLGFVNADHWALAVPIREDDPTLGAMIADESEFPRTVLVESILLYVAEALGDVR